MAKKKAARRSRRPATVKLPDETWKDSFKSSTFRTTFSLVLSQAMMEFICAVADDVTWDRGLYFSETGRHRPDNWVATAAALMKRGLIVRKCKQEIHRSSEKVHRKGWTWEEACEFSHYNLTPAGECVVQMMRAAGVFIEADAAITKKFRGA